MKVVGKDGDEDHRELNRVGCAIVFQVGGSRGDDDPNTTTFADARSTCVSRGNGRDVDGVTIVSLRGLVDTRIRANSQTSEIQGPVSIVRETSELASQLVGNYEQLRDICVRCRASGEIFAAISFSR